MSTDPRSFYNPAVLASHVVGGRAFAQVEGNDRAFLQEPFGITFAGPGRPSPAGRNVRPRTLCR